MVAGDTINIDANLKSASGRSQTIERAGLILACFSAEEPHLTLAELAAKLGLNQSTVYRYVASLQGAGILERDPRRGGYRLGLRVIELSSIALNQNEVRKQALDEMDRLRDELNLLVSVGVLFEGDVLHIAHSVPEHWPRWYTTVGRRAVAQCTSLGKVLLAARPWPEVAQLIERHGWRPYTRNSIQDLARLEAELAEVREQGYAIDLEERNQGTVCLGAPIRDYTGEVIAALSVSGKADKMTPAFRAQTLPYVREAADRISFRLGHHGSSAYL
jgi:DNA-binding IclR family transcriptional regulator